MKYRYSFEEKKKRVCVVAACVFIVLAGVVYLYNRQGGSGYTITASVNESDNSSHSAEGKNNNSKNSDSGRSADNSEGGDTNNEAENNAAGNSAANGDEESESGVRSSGMIYVHVCGAVKKPGVYKLAQGARVADAVESAGGFSKKASDVSLNLAANLEDGQKIYVPTKKEMEESGTGVSDNVINDGSNTVSSGDTKININTASKEELMTIPGIGEAKACSIIAYREENGTFKTIEDIMKIPGIKEGLFSKISDRIRV
jgi:competence protein ComEA